MSQYRRIPEIIDAYQVPPNDDQTREIPAWVIDAVASKRLQPAPAGDGVVVHTENSQVWWAPVGHYVCRKADGTFFTEHPAQFALKYELNT